MADAVSVPEIAKAGKRKELLHSFNPGFERGYMEIAVCHNGRQSGRRPLWEMEFLF